MSQILLGWPNGTVGMALAMLAGIILMIHAFRTTPWDIHDETTYQDSGKFTISSIVPSLILFAILISLVAGVGALDKGIWPPIAIVGDILGTLSVPGASLRAMKARW
jgi:hypothetical protein